MTRLFPTLRRLTLGLAPTLTLLACGEASDASATTEGDAGPDPGAGTVADAAAFEGARLLPDGPEAGGQPQPAPQRLFEGCRGVNIMTGTTLDVTLPAPAHLTFTLSHDGQPLRARGFRFVPRSGFAGESPELPAWSEPPFRYSLVPGRYDVWAMGTCGVDKTIATPELPCGAHLVASDVEIVGEMEQDFDVELRHVRGTVSVNGRPAEVGSVAYAAANGAGPSAPGEVDYAPVVGGAFDLFVAPGRGRLDFVDFRGPGDDGAEPIGPAELTAEVDSTAADVEVRRDLAVVTTRVEVSLERLGLRPDRPLIGRLTREGDPGNSAGVAVENAPPLAIATVVAVPGRYTLYLQEDDVAGDPTPVPTTQTLAPPTLVIDAGETIRVDTPTVTLQGRLDAPAPTAGQAAPLHVAFSALGAPVEVVADADGRFEAALLPGIYTVNAFREAEAEGGARVDYVGPAFEINADATLDLPLKTVEETTLESLFAQVEFTFETSGAALPHGMEPRVIDTATGQSVTSGALVAPGTGFFWTVGQVTFAPTDEAEGAPRVVPAAFFPTLTPGDTTSTTLSAKWVNVTGTVRRDPAVPVEFATYVDLVALTPGMSAGDGDTAGPNGHIAATVAEGPHVVALNGAGACDLSAFDPVPCNSTLIGCEE